MKMRTDDTSIVPLAPGMTALRWQVEAMLAIRKYLPEHKAVLVSAATGTGKGTLIASLIVKAARAGKRVLFLVHMDELIDDVMARALAIEPALYAGKVKAKLNEIDRHAVFASVQTLRGKRLDTLNDLPFDYVITDESHHSVAKTYQAVYARLAKVNPAWRHILLTATPFRNAGGGRTSGLGEVVKHLVYEYSLSDAITEGALCPIRAIRIDTKLDLSGIDPDDEEELEKMVDTDDRNRVVASKYVEHCVIGGEREEVVEVIHEEEGAVTHTYERITGGERRQAIVFAVSIAHAKRIAAEMVKRGIVAEPVWGLDKERTRKITGFKAGSIEVLTNNNLLCEGFDHRPVAAVLLVRPMQSRGLFAQQVGRVTRVSPGKKEGLVLDFVANSTKHDLVSFADLSRPEQDLPRIEPGAEVRHRRIAAKSKGMVESVEGWIDNDEQGTAMVLWRNMGDDSPGILLPEAEQEEVRNLVLVKPPKRINDEEETRLNPTVIGVNEFAITLFGDAESADGNQRAGWYTFTDSKRKKTLVAKDKERGKSAIIRQRQGEWEAWQRDGDTVSMVHAGEFAACEAAVRIDPDDYRAKWLRNPATEKQLATLAKFRVSQVDKLSAGEASLMIEAKIVGLLIGKANGARQPNRQTFDGNGDVVDWS
jgi:superfamily II DNA or RNA helicase